MEQKQLKQFTFYDLYWDLIKQSDDSSAGRMVRDICQYMFTDDEVTEPQDDKENFFWSNIVVDYSQGNRQKKEKRDDSITEKIFCGGGGDYYD